MKLSNLAIVFVIIAFVIIAVLSNYISIQRRILLMQNEYDSKLIDSTKESIDAFEINTVEWNYTFSENADSKRRSIMGSINTFTQTLANNMNMSGASREVLLSYVPAIAYTLYDGYYIYSPAEVKVPIRDDNGVAVIYSKETYKEIKNRGVPVSYKE